MGLNYYSMFLMEDGSVKAVGQNKNGQLGLGHKIYPVTEISDVPISEVNRVSCGNNYTMFLMEDGSVKVVGYNSYGQLGLGHTNTPVTEISDVPIDGVKQIACGYYHTIFLKEDGSVKAVGQNNNGQLGLGHKNYPVTEISDVPISGVKQVACGVGHTTFLMIDGSVKAVGYNGHGELGLGHTNTPISAISDISISGVKQLSCGYNHTMFLMEDGSVKAVGRNDFGQLGLGHRNSPVPEVSDVPISGVKQVSCGSLHTIFLLEDGSVKSVGYNSNGQLGLGHTNYPVTEISDVPISGVKQVSCGYYHTLFLMEDGSVKAVGQNNNGQLGLGHTNSPITHISNVNVQGVKLLMNIDNVNVVVKQFLLKTSENIYAYNSSWEALGETETEDMFKTKGMTDLSHIPIEEWYHLESPVEILYYTNEEEGQPPLIEFDANYSPIDELEGPFDVVTWTNQGNKELVMNAIPYGQFIYGDNDLSIAAGLLEVSVNQSAADEGIIILLSFDQGESWMTYDEGFITVSDDPEVFKERGIKGSNFNNITQEKWEAAANGKDTLRFAYFIPNEAAIEDITLTTKGTVTETPELNRIAITYDELTIEGRLKDLERANRIHLAQLNFKANALMESERFNLHDLVIDTMEDTSGFLMDSTTAIFDGVNGLLKGVAEGSLLTTIEEDLRLRPKQLFITAEGEGIDKIEYTLDHGQTWTIIQNNELTDILAADTGILQFRFHFTNESSFLNQFAYGWV